jgi:orotate phosphoribosyltransferase
MQKSEIIQIFRETGAYKQGHFLLSSGLHSGAYLQCALVLQNPVIAHRLCGVLAQKFLADEPDVVVGPAMGGIIFAYELARALNARAVFTERDSEGNMKLRRGFSVTPQNNVLIAEDVLTTGGSVNEVLDLLKMDGVVPSGIAALVDRSTVPLDFGGIKHESLLKLDVPAFEEGQCPLCQEGMKLEKPGSRKEIL